MCDSVSPSGAKCIEMEDDMDETVRPEEIHGLRFFNPEGLYNPAHNGYSHWRSSLLVGE